MGEKITLPDGREMDVDDYNKRLELLKKPFEPQELEKLPKQLRKNDDDRGRCEQGSRYSADGHYCGGWHARSMHLDYVGHAGITDRLNEVDPLWNWEPFALTPHGTPLCSDGGMWGRLTVLGMTRIGFGDANGKQGPSATKEMIGDFIRNAAMRFGVATYLWSKSEAALEKKLAEEPPEPTRAAHPPVEQGPDWKQLYDAATGSKDRLQALRNQARQAGLPDAHPMFGAINQQLESLKADEPIEGALIP